LEQQGEKRRKVNGREQAQKYPTHHKAVVGSAFGIE